MNETDQDRATVTYDAMLKRAVPIGPGERVAVAELLRGESVVDCGSTKRVVYGPGVMVWTIMPTGVRATWYETHGELMDNVYEWRVSESVRDRVVTTVQEDHRYAMLRGEDAARVTAGALDLAVDNIVDGIDVDDVDEIADHYGVPVADVVRRIADELTSRLTGGAA